MLVFATDLEQVEEVCGSGVNGDQVLVWFGRWVRQIGDLEVLRTLMVVSFEASKVLISMIPEHIP